MTNRKENSQRTLPNAVTQVQSPDARSFATLRMTHSSEHTTLQPIPCGSGIMGGVCEWTMEQYLTHVRSTFYRAQVDGMRRETDPTRKSTLKKKLFWILPQGRIKPGHRQVLGTQPTKEDIEYAPWQMLDLDTLPEGCATPADAWYQMRHRLHAQGLAHYPMVVMESASGGGLHIYVRLTEEMSMMNRREVILLWNDILSVEFDPAVTDPARRAFQSYNLFSAESEIALLFGAELTDEQREAMIIIEKLKLKIEKPYRDSVMLSEVKHLANVSCQAPARDPSYRQDDTNTELTQSTVPLRQGDECSAVYGAERRGYDNIAINDNQRLCHPEYNEGSRGVSREEVKVPARDPSYRQDDTNTGSLHPDGNSQFSTFNFQFSAIAQQLLLLLCGTTTPPEGSRNNTLYEAARQMAYIDGITEEGMLAAFAPLGYLGLPEREARQCIRSAMRHEKTWLYTLPPALARAMEQTHPIPPCEGGGSDIAEPKVLPHREDLGGSTPPLISLFTTLVPEHTREAAASMIFAPLGSYLNNTVTIDDVSGQERNLQFTSIVVGNSSSGKGFTGTLSDLITERHRQRDVSSWAQLDAWQEQKRTTPKGETAPPKPDVPLYLLASNMTEPALLERLKALEPHHGRAYINVPEIDDLRKMQTVSSSRLGAGQEIILSAFDTARYGALRVSAEAVSAITVMSLNIVATSTYPGTQDFFQRGVERGSVGRCDISIVPDCYDVPRYGKPTPEFFAQLDTYIDRLEGATGHIQSDDIDRLVEEIRLAYNDPHSPLSHQQNPEYYKLSHRQLLITKQKATILYICNNYQWDTAWEPWLHHSFYYGMECKISVFKAEIESWIKRQCAAATANIIMRSGPKSELDGLPQTFTLDDIVAMKRKTAPPAETDDQLTIKAKTLIRTWRNRKRIIPTEKEGTWEKC